MDQRDLVKPECFLGDVGTLCEEEKRNTVEGIGILLLGFPLRLNGKARVKPLTGQGIIARM